MEEDYPGSRTFIMEAYRLKGLPEDSIPVVLSSLTDATHKQYNSVLKRWWKFSKTIHSSPFNASVNNIIDFLNHEFKLGASFGTINTAKSALSLIMSPEVGKDYRIKRFLKGIQNLRPQRPKYNTSWDPALVLNYLKNLYPNEGLGLEDLSLKLSTLLALITAHRVQTLSLIKIENIKYSEMGVDIFIPDRIKTSGKNKQPILQLPYYKDDECLCAVKCLETYILVTKNIRQAKHTKLFLTHKKPHHEASAQTISRWIRSTLQKSGVDTTTFTAHSTRHAATSAAARNGINLDLIRKTAGWSKSSETFARFYNRPLAEKYTFASCILSLSKT